MTRWAGYCAPGQKPIAEILALLAPERVESVEETTALTGQTGLILINLDAITFPDPPFEFPDITSRPVNPVDLITSQIRRHGWPGLITGT
jgi:hypothetical protein